MPLIACKSVSCISQLIQLTDLHAISGIMSQLYLPVWCNFRCYNSKILYQRIVFMKHWLNWSFQTWGKMRTMDLAIFKLICIVIYVKLWEFSNLLSKRHQGTNAVTNSPL
jgi:hypothetical protein